jgi:hypothetical protein
MFTATRIQVASYLFGVCLFSISFLVFLNSSISFVVTDLLKQHDGVGDAVVSIFQKPKLLDKLLTGSEIDSVRAPWASPMN